MCFGSWFSTETIVIEIRDSVLDFLYKRPTFLSVLFAFYHLNRNLQFTTFLFLLTNVIITWRSRLDWEMLSTPDHYFQTQGKTRVG